MGASDNADLVTDARVRAGVAQLVELGVPDEALAPIRIWLGQRYADRVRAMIASPIDGSAA